MTTRRRKKHRPEEVVAKLRDADAMLNAGKDLAAVLQALEISEPMLKRWRAQYGGMKCEEAKRLKHLEDLRPVDRKLPSADGPCYQAWPGQSTSDYSRKQAFEFNSSSPIEFKK
jgi:putative transposase